MKFTTGPARPMSIRCQRGFAVNVAGSSGDFVGRLLRGVLARHLHKPAQREQADLVVGIAVFEAEQARSEAEGEGFDAHSEKLGHDKMTKLVQDHDQADKDDEGCGRNQKLMHRWSVIPSAKRGLSACDHFGYASNARARSRASRSAASTSAMVVG